MSRSCGIGGLGSSALDARREDHVVVDDAADRGGRRHGALEDLVPLGEGEVGRDGGRAALVALGQEREEDALPRSLREGPASRRLLVRGGWEGRVASAAGLGPG